MGSEWFRGYFRSGMSRKKSTKSPESPKLMQTTKMRSEKCCTERGIYDYVGCVFCYLEPVLDPRRDGCRHGVCVGCVAFSCGCSP
jgi:hypothetical protein